MLAWSPLAMGGHSRKRRTMPFNKPDQMIRGVLEPEPEPEVEPDAEPEVEPEVPADAASGNPYDKLFEHNRTRAQLARESQA